MTGLTDPVFRPDGRLVYAARRAGAEPAVVVEGEAEPLYSSPAIIHAGPAVSSDGAHVAHIELADKRLVEVIDGKRGAGVEVHESRSTGARGLTFGPTGPALAYVRIAGGRDFNRGASLHALRKVITTSGTDQPEFDAMELINLTYGDDGRHLAYEVHGAKSLQMPGAPGKGSFVVLDGKPGNVYSSVMYRTMRFTSPTSVAFLARTREGDGKAPHRFYRVTQSVQ